MRTIVYIDGFNLYYGALRGTSYKWLDLHALFRSQVLNPGTQLIGTRYYTAPVKASASDDPESPRRQHRYLRALKAHCGDKIDISHGYITRTTPLLRLVGVPPEHAHSLVKVYHFIEKQTDVNLTADMISDVWRKRCEQVVLCSNDSDLAGALAAIRRDHPKVTLGLVVPSRDGRYVSSHLRKYAHWYKILSPAHFADAQLPDKIRGTPLTRPEAWKEAAVLRRLT